MSEGSEQTRPYKRSFVTCWKYPTKDKGQRTSEKGQLSQSAAREVSAIAVEISTWMGYSPNRQNCYHASTGGADCTNPFQGLQQDCTRTFGRIPLRK